MGVKDLRIHVVTISEEGWVLRRIGESFSRCLSAPISLEADPEADVNFYVHYQTYRKPTRCDVAFFTHREHDPPFSALFDDIANRVDWCVAMSKRTSEDLPKEKTSILKIAPDEQFRRVPLVLGVVGRDYPSGRKRYDWIPELRKIKGIEIRCTNGEYEFKDLPKFYENINYLLVLSSNEGGPLPVLEALAMGKPIIAPDVGFAWEYPCIRYKNFEELHELLLRLVLPHDNWERIAREAKEIFRLAVASKVR